MPPSPQGPSVMSTLETFNVSGEGEALKKTQVELKDSNNNATYEVDIPQGEKLEILYDGYYYDITDFIKRHPGGDVIQGYASNGEDATIAIQEIHRSMKKVRSIMKGLKKRPATDEEIGLDPETEKRHDELTKDFPTSAEELKAEGLMDPNPKRFGTRIFQSLLTSLRGRVRPRADRSDRQTGNIREP